LKLINWGSQISQMEKPEEKERERK